MNEMNQSAYNDKEVIPENPSDMIQCILDDDFDWLIKQIASLFGFSNGFLMLWDGKESHLKSYFGKPEGIYKDWLQTLSAQVYSSKGFYVIENLASHSLGGNVHESANLNFFLGVPFKTKAGAVIAAIGLLHEVQPPTYSENQLALLRMMVMLMTDNIELRYRQKTASDKEKLANRKFTHDLRNPLTVISLNADIINMETNLPSGVKDMCNQVKQAAGSMNQLIDTFAAIQKNAH